MCWTVVLLFKFPVHGYTPDPPPEQPTCLTNWCEVVKCPSGSCSFKDIEFLPQPPVCGSMWIAAVYDCTPSEAVTRTVWSPPGPGCPPSYHTNIAWPSFVTNWWVLTWPNGAVDSGAGDHIWFWPVMCGRWTISFYGIWKNWHPCTGEPIGCGAVSISRSPHVIVTNHPGELGSLVVVRLAGC